MGLHRWRNVGKPARRAYVPVRWAVRLSPETVIYLAASAPCFPVVRWPSTTTTLHTAAATRTLPHGKGNMGDAADLREKSMAAEEDLQAFDYARKRAGDVTELFGVLKGRLRPGQKGPELAVGEEGKASSGHSVLQAQYSGSSGSTVLSQANLKRIQTFLDEPQKHLGQVIADIEKEAGNFYEQVSSLKPAPKRLQRGRLNNPLVKNGQLVSLEDVPEMNKYLGPSSRFGDGDGSFWDRWLTTTGHFTEQGNYAKAHIPTRSMYATGTVPPRSGFKRYQLDKLAFPEHPEPRVLSYAARRELADTAKGDDAPKRLRGAYSERCLSPATTAWLDDVLAKKAAEEAKAAEEGRKNKDGLNQKEEIARTDTRCSTAPRTSSSGGEGGLSDGPEQAPAVLKHLRQKFRTLGDVGARRGSPERPVVWHSALVDETKEETPEEKEAPCGLCAGSPEKKEDVSGEVTVGVRRRSMEGAIASLGLVHPNYFGKRARMHMYSYFKQVSRRKHQYGDRQAMALIPLSPLDRMDMLSTYEASVDVIKTVSSQDMISLADIPFADGPMDGKHTGGGSSDDTLQRRLPPLVMPGAVSGGRITRGGKEEKDQSSSLDEAGGTPHVTSRTKYLVRCTEYNVAPKANIIIRKTLTTKVNLAHQGMGDVMGGILADCLVGLPLMRELNLRDNRLTDKGLIPIVKAIKQRHDLYALDLSENKLDRWAARELAVYFSDPKTTLAKFVLSKADVDDFEAANFVKHMRHNKTLTSLDISHNLIGSQESINYVRPEFYTGAEALADWISTGSCPLKYLDVSWNTIRLDSAVYFGNAVAYATHLEELDLSFNCFGAKGGEAIGASLHINTSLKKLGLASNSINPRACFVICQGLRYSSSIRSINLANNALGRIGVGCVMALTAEIGDAIKIQLAHCNFMVDSEDCWFEDDKLKPSYTLQLEEPYDRAVALHLTRRAARDEGLKLKVVTHTIIGESEKEIKLERKIAAAESLVADHAFWKEIFHKYDANGSGSLDRGELAEALRDLDVAGGIQVDVVMSRHDNGDDRIEEAEFHEFVHASILQSRRRADRSKAFIAEESKPGTPWVVPWEGKLRVELQYNRLHNQGCHTSLESTDGVLAMLEGIGDGLAEVMTHALDCISVDLEQGFRMYTAVLKRLGGDKIKALAKVIPRMESTSDARLLKNTILSGLDERRKLRHNLGPAYRPLMGTPMGHYELDMAKPTHRMAARKILEINNMEKLARQAGPPLVFDVSQKGNWDNIRNETMNGKPFRFKSGILEDNSHKAGLLAMDYVSTARRSVKSGGVANPQQAVMNAKRFHEMLHLVGLSEDVDWAEVSEEDFDQAIDDALAESPPRPRTPQLFEQLHFLMTGEGPAGTKRPILTRPSAVDKQANAGGQKQSVPKSILQSGFGAKSNLGQIESEETGEQSNEQRNPGLGILTGAHVGLNAMACRLDELMADRWLSIRQCRFMVLAVEEAFEGDEVLQDVIVDFVVTVYPRIVDVHDYLVLVGCLEERSAAFVLKRVGMLAAWNACRPDGYLELALDRKEERLVAKMLVHLKTEERGEQWVSTSFRWSMYDQPTPGWMLPLAWHTEEGIPTKGVLTCEYRTGPHINWIVRLALARTLSLCELPPGGAALGIMGTGNRPASPTGGGARIGEEGDLEGRNKRVMSGVGSYDVDSPFDREFVDALCRQAGNNFFLYGGS